MMRRVVGNVDSKQQRRGAEQIGEAKKRPRAQAGVGVGEIWDSAKIIGNLARDTLIEPLCQFKNIVNHQPGVLALKGDQCIEQLVTAMGYIRKSVIDA